MYQTEEIAQVKELLALGLPKTAIADQLKISRRVIYYWLSAGYLDAPSVAGQRIRIYRKPHKLRPFHDLIDARLDANPDISTPQLLRELQAAGYQGGLTQLRVHLASRRRVLV